MKIYCLGSRGIENDDLALRVGKKIAQSAIPGISEIRVTECLRVDDLFDLIVGSPKEESLDKLQEIIFLDVAEGIRSVQLITDLSSLYHAPLYSNHDLDMSFFITLLQKLGRIGKVSIIAIPLDLDEDAALKQVKEKIVELSDALS